MGGKGTCYCVRGDVEGPAPSGVALSLISLGETLNLSFMVQLLAITVVANKKSSFSPCDEWAWVVLRKRLSIQMPQNHIEETKTQEQIAKRERSELMKNSNI